MTEGELEFDFAGCVRCERLDQPGVPTPEGMSFVDFVVEEALQLLLIEVKDPACSRAPSSALPGYVAKLRGDELINGQLVPKCRDSYTYLHLMAQDHKPRLFVVVIGAGAAPYDPALLLAFQGRLDARLRQEANQPWIRPYVTGSVVVDEHQWQRMLPGYHLHRR